MEKLNLEKIKNKMKIKRFNENFDWESDTELIKDIIIEIKDDYPNISGKIQESENYILIRLDNIEEIDFGKIYTLERFKNIMKFENLIIECAERISDALDRKVLIQGDLYSVVRDGQINIFVYHN